MKRTDSTSTEKLALLALAGGCIVSLTWIALAAIKAGTVDPNASTLIGVIAAGLIAFGKDIVAAIRSYAMAAQLGKVTDQLADSTPKARPSPDNAEGVEEAAQDTADAAQAEADAIRNRPDA